MFTSYTLFKFVFFPIVTCVEIRISIVIMKETNPKGMMPKNCAFEESFPGPFKLIIFKLSFLCLNLKFQKFNKAKWSFKD